MLGIVVGIIIMINLNGSNEISERTKHSYDSAMLDPKKKYPHSSFLCIQIFYPSYIHIHNRLLNRDNIMEQKFFFNFHWFISNDIYTYGCDLVHTNRRSLNEI